MVNTKIAKNYIYNITYQILVLITPLVTTPYISRVLGAKGIGIFSYTDSIVTYFILFGTVGCALYGEREIAYVRNDISKRTVIFKEIVTLRFFTVFISLAVYIPLFGYGKEYSIIYNILIIEIVANAFDISWFFQGLEEFKKTVARNIIVKLISVACIFVFIKTPKDVPLYAMWYALPILIGNISLWFYLPHYLNEQKINLFACLKHLTPMSLLFIPQIATNLYTVLDKTMIGNLATNIQEVGYYDQSQKIVKIALSITTSLGIVMLPAISHAFSLGKQKEIKKSIEKSFRFIFMLACPIMFGLIGISNNFVPWFFGSGFEKVNSLIVLISPIVLVIGISNVLGTQYMLPTKQQKGYTISVIIGALINFLLNFLLIPKFNSSGAAIATVIAELGVTLTQIYFIRKQLNIRRCLLSGLTYFIVALIMGIIIYLFGFIIPQKMWGTFVQIVLGSIIYVFALYLFKDRLILDALQLVNAKINRMR